MRRSTLLYIATYRISKAINISKTVEVLNLKHLVAPKLSHIYHVYPIYFPDGSTEHSFLFEQKKNKPNFRYHKNDMYTWDMKKIKTICWLDNNADYWYWLKVKLLKEII